MTVATLDEYQFFVNFSEVGTQTMLDNYGQTIHDDYMSIYGEARAATIGVYLVQGAYGVQIQFRGPADSVTWLQDAISAAAQSEGGTAEFLTLKVESEITDFFESSETRRS